MSETRRARVRIPTVQLPVAGTATATLLALTGCQNPIATQTERQLARSVVESLERELSEAETVPEARTLSRTGSTDELEIRPEHLEQIERDFSPAGYRAQLSGDDADGIVPLLGEDLLGRPHRTVAIGLEHVLATTAAGNLDVQVARLGPAISEAQVVQAEAAFDWLFSTGLSWQDAETPTPGQQFTGGAIVTASETVVSDTSLSRSLTSGGTFSVGQRVTWNDVRTDFFGAAPDPNPATTLAFDFEFAQPLLRGAGSDFALAEVRIARNAERREISALRATMLDRVTDAEDAYWDLVQRYNELIIQQKLLDRGIGVRDDIKARRVQDARQAQVADAVARVERRKGDLLRAQTQLRRASDALKAIMNDAELPVGSETLLIPVDAAIDEPIAYSLAESIATAAQERPEIEQAVLSIDDASIRQQVARNLRRPQLDLQAALSLIGLDEDLDESYENSVESRFVDEMLFGVVFSQPIGNRSAEANYRRRRLERMQSVISYRRAVQNVVLDVKTALDDVVTNYKLIEQARLSRIAQGEALRTLQVEKRLTELGYTVERLNLELNQQESLASAEIDEIRALVDYNRAIAQLHRAQGTALRRSRIDFVVPDVNQIEPGNRALDYRLPRSSSDREGPGT